MEWELGPIDQNYQLEQIAKTYALVFAGKPWFEVSKCSLCGIFSGNLPDLKVLCSCDEKGEYSLEAYPLGETKDYILEELNHTNAIGLVAVARLAYEDPEVVGFAWGYGLTKAEMSETKWKSQEMRHLVNNRIGGISFFYVSEVGVLDAYQGFKIGKGLTNELVQQGKDAHCGQIVLRTSEDSPMRYLAEKLGLEPVIGLNSGFTDIENPKRILFEGQVK